MKKNFTLGSGTALLLAVLLNFHAVQESNAQLLVDNFNRANSNVIGNGWTESETIVPSSISIASNALLLESNVTGREFISKITPGTYETVLTNNPCKLEWSFNMRQNALNPNGLTATNHGVAMVLAGSSGDLLQGQGYAVVLGSPNTFVDPLRLVRYSNGLTNNNGLTDLVTVGSFNNQSLSIKVTYDPVTEQWEMFYATTGATFTDPQLANTSAGTATDAFYTNTALNYIGCLWNHGIVNSTRAHFDNIRVPFGCSSRVDFTTASGTVGSLDGWVIIPLTLVNPHFTNSANVTVQLTSGNAAIIDGFTSGIVTFPGGATQAQLNLAIPVNGMCSGDQTLTFTIGTITGGSGTPYVGPISTYTLTVEDDLSASRVVLDESFETDGAGSRYTLNAAHAAPGEGSYFIRGGNAAITAAGGVNLSNLDGSSCIGVSDLNDIAPDAEAILTFNALDILGMSAVNVSLRAGARYATNYDQASAQRDQLLIEANIDGTGWFTAGAFRSHKENPFVDGWFALDADLDGVGEGVKLDNTLTNFNFPVNVQGSVLELRIRMRTTAADEDIYIDKVNVSGVLCTPIFFSTGSGSENSAIWSNTRNGAGAPMALDKNASLIIQNGHVITATGATRRTNDLTVETGGVLHLQTADWTVNGDRLMNDGLIDATTGVLRLETSDPATISGAGNFQLFTLRLRTPAGTVASSNIDIRGTIAIEEGILNASASEVRLLSSATGTGRLGRIAAGSDYIGELTMQRYVPAGNTNWRFIGSPVAGKTVQHWHDDFYTAGYPGSNYPNFYSPPGSGIFWPSVRWYNETHPGPNENDGLTGVTSSMPLAKGKGFAAWCGSNFTTTNAFVIDVKGAPHIAHSPITLPMTYTNTGNTIADGYNLVSNPLPSPIAFSELALGADISNAYWIYDPITGSNASWNGVVGTNGANGIIQSSQAFWLKANGPAITTTISENAKVTNNTGGVFGDEITNMAMMRLRVIDAQMEYSDETLIVFGMGTPVLDDQDVVKMAFGHPAAPSIASQLDGGTELSINMYGMPTTAITIPVNVEVPVTATYTIQATDIGIIAGLSCVKLKDLVTGEEYQLNEGSEFEFMIEAGDNATPRFEVRMSGPIQRELSHVTCHGLNDGAVSVTILDGST
ncbi:MAG: hypothetical protein M3R08_04715, partial [Bacteroidota bacterium]|nr:hypothetical protein [Bacteroidota bacterium]